MALRRGGGNLLRAKHCARTAPSIFSSGSSLQSDELQFGKPLSSSSASRTVSAAARSFSGFEITRRKFFAVAAAAACASSSSASVVVLKQKPSISSSDSQSASACSNSNNKNESRVGEWCPTPTRQVNIFTLNKSALSTASFLSSRIQHKNQQQHSASSSRFLSSSSPSSPSSTSASSPAPSSASPSSSTPKEKPSTPTNSLGIDLSLSPTDPSVYGAPSPPSPTLEKLIAPFCREEKTRQVWVQICRYLWPSNARDLRRRVVISVACLLAAKVATLQVPVFFKFVVDNIEHASVAGVAAVPVALVLGYGAARVASSALGEFRTAVFSKVTQNAVRHMSLQLFERVHNLDLSFHLSKQTGQVSRSIERGTRGLNLLLQSMLFQAIPTFFEISLVSGVLLYYYHYSFAVITLATVVSYAAWTVVVTQRRTKIRQEMNRRESQASGLAVDSLLNYETVKYFTNERLELARYNDALMGFETASRKTTESLSLLNFGQSAVFTVGLTAAMLMAARGVVDGTMTMGDLVMINGILFQVSLPLNFLGMMYREVKQSLTDIEAMFALLNVESKVKDDPNAPPLAVKGGEIEFDNVSFSYGSRKIFDGLSFRVPAGGTIAIVGPSGGGKSTILRLLYRFFDAQSGSIRIDGQDIRDVSLASVRRHIGVVAQDTVLFNDSLRYNIQYGNIYASEAQVMQALEAAQLSKTLELLPQGLDTKVGERGLKLSGGEKQRVAIARAMLKEPAIMLCDEASSALDTHTEQQLMKRLFELSQHRTFVLIAHRLSTIVDADAILVIDGGKVVEYGTHSALVEKGGLYAELWERQRNAQAVEEANETSNPKKK